MSPKRLVGHHGRRTGRGAFTRWIAGASDVVVVGRDVREVAGDLLDVRCQSRGEGQHVVLCTRVRCRRGVSRRARTRSGAQRSTPEAGVGPSPAVATSCGVRGGGTHPPPAYVPSVFSRTTTRSTPSFRRPGRRGRGGGSRRGRARSANRRSRPRSITPAGRRGCPPRPGARRSRPGSPRSAAPGEDVAVAQVRSPPRSKGTHSKETRRRTASSATGTTSWPIPSPGMTPIR